MHESRDNKISAEIVINNNNNTISVSRFKIKEIVLIMPDVRKTKMCKEEYRDLNKDEAYEPYNYNNLYIFRMRKKDKVVELYKYIKGILLSTNNKCFIEYLYEKDN